jgi:LysM domain.
MGENMANKVPDGYVWVKNIDPNAKYDSKTKTIETEYKIYKPDEYVMVDGKAYVSDPYVSRYKRPKELDGIQHDPGQTKIIDFKQEYNVVIRKKTYYAITQGDDEEYLEAYQINNFTGLRTSHNVYGKGSATIILKGNEKVIISTKRKTKERNWNSFQHLLKGWNNIDIEKWGEYNGVKYNDLQRTREKAYDWAYAEKTPFEPMDEVYIFAKSPHRDKTGEYPFVQIFFGYISSVQKTYQAGQSGPQITINADDQLKLLSYSRIANRLPADMSVTGTAFRYDGAGNFIVENDWLLNGINLDSRNSDGSYNPRNVYREQVFTNMFAGSTPYEIIKRCCIEAGIAEKFLKNRIEKITRIPFMPQMRTTSSGQELFMGEFKNRLWFCEEAASKLNLEFFADEEGNIVLKIPTYNIGINKLIANNLGVETPIILSENKDGTISRTLKLTSLYVSTSEPDMYYITIKSESLYDIARRVLNNGALWTQLWELNPNIKDASWVPAGTRILLTEKEDKTRKINKSYKETVKISSTNSLSEITDEYIPIIYPEQIISFSFVDSDKELYNSVQVSVEVPYLDAQMNAVPQAITRTVADFESIKKFGFREHPAVSTPIIASADAAALYAGLLLLKSAANRYTGSLTIIEDASIKVGQPIRMMVYDEIPFSELYKRNSNNDASKAQAVFYVDAIDRNIRIGEVSYMTLSLKAGRMMGMPSIYDNCQGLYRYYYEDLDVSLSLSVEEIEKEASKANVKTQTSSSNNKSSNSSNNSSKSNSSSNSSNNSTKITWEQKVEESYKDYKGKTYTVLSNKELMELKNKHIRDPHSLIQNKLTNSLDNIAFMFYGDSKQKTKIINANKGLPDGTGPYRIFPKDMTSVKVGQKLRIPHPISPPVSVPRSFINEILK